MPPAQFYLSPNPDAGAPGAMAVICSDEPVLRVEVYRLDGHQAAPGNSSDHFIFYCDHNGHLLAFVTGCAIDQLPVATAAISWYADEVGTPELKHRLRVDDPRPASRMRLVKK